MSFAYETMKSKSGYGNIAFEKNDFESFCSVDDFHNQDS